MRGNNEGRKVGGGRWDGGGRDKERDGKEREGGIGSSVV